MLFVLRLEGQVAGASQSSGKHCAITEEQTAILCS